MLKPKRSSSPTRTRRSSGGDVSPDRGTAPIVGKKKRERSASVGTKPNPDSLPSAHPRVDSASARKPDTSPGTRPRARSLSAAPVAGLPQNNSGTKMARSSVVRSATDASNTSQRSTTPVMAKVRQVDLKTIFTNLKSVRMFPDDTFQSAETAQSIHTFVRIRDGNLEMSNAFREGLDVLAHVTRGEGPMYKAVVADLQALQQGTAPDKLANLQSFIDYQVYKVGEHYRTHDEEKWTRDIAADVMTKVPKVKALYDDLVEAPVEALINALERGDEQAVKRITGSNQEIDKATLEKAKDTKGLAFDGLRKATETLAAAPLLRAIEKEVAKHYMCRMRYTQPIPSLVDRETPGFIQERLRFQDTGQPIFLFETSNGYTIAYDSIKFASHTEAWSYAARKLSLPLDRAKIEFTPFDPKRSMIATMQVPVMSEPITLHLSLEDQPALDAPVELDVTIGKFPEDMGYQMTDEPAGVFRRSLNSQRVTEIQGADDEGDLVTFQMKGAGVPAYGFDMANAGNAEMGTFTGSEFFKLNAEMGSIGLRSFAITAFNNDRIAPQTLGMTLAADKAHASSSGTRNGAISFRADYSLGVRLENVLPVFGKEPDATIIAMRDKMGFKTGEMDKRKNEMLNTMARNLAITHLFGMHYDDSSMKDLADVGLAGEFSDSGTLRNLDPSTPAPVEGTTFVNQGVRTMLGSAAAEAFPSRYADHMVHLLLSLAAKSSNMWLGRLVPRLTTDIKDPVDRLHFLRQLAASLGGSSNKPTPVQQAFYMQGFQGYVEVLCQNLQEKFDHLDQFKAERFVADLSQAHAAYKRLGFNSIKELEEALSPILEKRKQEAVNAITTLDSQIQAPEIRLELEPVLKDARAATDSPDSPDNDADSLSSIHHRIGAALAKTKTTRTKEQDEQLSAVEDRRVKATAELVKITAGVKDIRGALEAVAKPDTNRVKSTPVNPPTQRKVVIQRSGVNQTGSQSALLADLLKSRTLKTGGSPAPDPTEKDKND
jgi:hypothetical protein